MIRIIHLSDLHLRSKPSREENENAAVLVGGILDRYGAGNKKTTLVVITGDLVDDAKQAQYEHVRDTVLNPLEQKFTVLAVAGNHDYARWGNFFDADAPARFRKFVDFPEYPEPKIHQVVADGQKVVLIGVDSADPENKVFFANGVVDKLQRQGVRQALDDEAFADFFKVVYVHHHPFLRDMFVSFKKADEFLEVVSTKVHLMLFGHKHVHEAFVGRYDVPIMLASGKVTQRTGDMLAFRVIELDDGVPPRIYTVEVPAT